MIDRLSFGWFLIAGLAAYRIAMLLTWDNGPFDCFERLRIWAGRYEYDDQGDPASFTGKLLNCPYCVGVWAGVICVLLLMMFHPVAYFILAALGIAGVQFAVTRAVEGVH